MQRSRTLTRLGLSFTLLPVFCFGFGSLSPCYPQDATVGGTEVRSLVAHGGTVYAGDGYWGDNGVRGAEILVLDHGRWRVDHSFDERNPRGYARHLAVASMGQVEFTTDANGKPLPEPASVLLASTWDLTGELHGIRPQRRHWPMGRRDACARFAGSRNGILGTSAEFRLPPRPRHGNFLCFCRAQPARDFQWRLRSGRSGAHPLEPNARARPLRCLLSGGRRGEAQGHQLCGVQ